MTTWNTISPTTGTSYKPISSFGNRTYDDPLVIYDDPNCLYDGVNNSWVTRPAASGTTWITEPNPTG